MENRKITEYSNASEIDASKIPQSVINQLASLLYEVFQDSTYETEHRETA